MNDFDINLYNAAVDRENSFNSTIIGNHKNYLTKIEKDIPWVPLDIAICMGNINMIKCLIECGGISKVSIPMDYAQQSPDKAIEIFEILADKGFYSNSAQTLITLALDKNPYKLEKMLKKGLDPNSFKYVQRPLYIAVYYNLIQNVKLLLQHNSDINHKDKDGNAALHIAIEKNAYEITEFLLRNNAQINIQNKKGYTPLHIAAQAGKIEMTRLLLSYKVDTSIKDNAGKTALDLTISPAVKELLGPYALTRITGSSTSTSLLAQTSINNINNNLNRNLLGTITQTSQSYNINNNLNYSPSVTTTQSSQNYNNTNSNNTLNYPRSVIGTLPNQTLSNNNNNSFSYPSLGTITQLANNSFLQQQVRRLEQENKAHLAEIKGLKKQLQQKDVIIGQLTKIKSEVKQIIKQETPDWRTQIENQRKIKRESNELDENNNRKTVSDNNNFRSI